MIYFAYGGHPVGQQVAAYLEPFYADRGIAYSHGSTIQDCDHLIVWNGRGDYWAGTEYWLACEVGWLPQSSTWYANRGGTTGLAKWPDFTPELADDYGDWKAEFAQRQQRKVVTGDQPAKGRDPVPEPPYVLVIGQMERDTSLIGSPIQSMAQLVAMVKQSTDLPVVFRPHPGDTRVVDYGVPVVRWSPLYETLANAEAVVAISSTCLLEAAMLGTPAICCGYNVFSDIPAPYTIPRAGSVASLTRMLRQAWDWWQPDYMIDYLRRQQIDRINPVLQENLWLP